MPDSRNEDPILQGLVAPAAPLKSALTPIDSLPFTVSLRRVNLGVGYTAACLPLAVWLPGFLLGTCAQNNGLDSISHYYYSPIGGDLFVGALFLIGMLMLFFFTVPDAAESVEAVSQVDEYRRFSQRDLRLAKIAGAMAFLIALMPTNGSGCALSDDTMRAYLLAAPGTGLFASGTHSVDHAVISFDLGAVSGIPFTAIIHSLAAGIMFSILGYFSLFVFTRVQSAKSMKTPTSTGFKKKMRNAIYVVSGITIFAAVLALIFKYAACNGAEDCSYDASNFTFWAETLALLAFGFSWLTKGRFIGWLSDDPQPRAA